MELYLRLPYAGEVELLSDELPVGSSVLELGCGVGRMTRHLLAKGHGVTVVDNSRDMLSHVPEEAEKICSDIELLRVERKFDVVFLASCLINTPDESVRLAQLTACHRHLRAGGRLLFQRIDPQWLLTAERGRVSMVGEVELGVDEIRRNGDLVAISLRYAAREMEWKQHFVAQVMDDDVVQDVLAKAGFGRIRWISRTWGSAGRHEDGMP